MAISYRGSQAAGSSATKVSSQAVSKASGAVDGDVMLTLVTVQSTASVTTLSGWTLQGDIVGTNFKSYLFTKVANGEGASYTWAFTASTTYASIVSVAYAGVDHVQPIDTFNEGTTASGVASTTPSTTADYSTDWFVGMWSRYGTTSPAQSYTGTGSSTSGRTDVIAGASAVFVSGVVFDSGGPLVTPGAVTGTMTDTSTSSQWGAWGIALKAARPAATNVQQGMSRSTNY